MRSKSEIFLRKNKICLRQLPGTCLKRSGSVRSPCAHMFFAQAESAVPPLPSPHTVFQEENCSILSLFILNELGQYTKRREQQRNQNHRSQPYIPSLLPIFLLHLFNLGSKALEIALRLARGDGLTRQKRLPLGIALYNLFSQFRHCRPQVAEPEEGIVAGCSHTIKADIVMPFNHNFIELN